MSAAALTRTRAPKIAGRDMSPANEEAFRGLARSLRAAGKSDKTAAAYHQACLSLEAYLAGMPAQAPTCSRRPRPT